MTSSILVLAVLRWQCRVHSGLVGMDGFGPASIRWISEDLDSMSSFPYIYIYRHCV